MLRESDTEKERPPIPWNRIILDEAQAAELLGMPRPQFRERAARGEFVRIPYGRRSFRYWAYDLLDWAYERREA